MLLSLMRRHAKSWLIKFLIAIIAIVFVFYFGYSFTARKGLKAAVVNGDVITRQEYEKTYMELVEALHVGMKVPEVAAATPVSSRIKAAT